MRLPTHEVVTVDANASIADGESRTTEPLVASTAKTA